MWQQHSAAWQQTKCQAVTCCDSAYVAKRKLLLYSCSGNLGSAGRRSVSQSPHVRVHVRARPVPEDVPRPLYRRGI